MQGYLPHVLLLSCEGIQSRRHVCSVPKPCGKGVDIQRTTVPREGSLWYLPHKP